MRGYTLLELIIGMATSVVLLGGLSSTLYISSRALNTESSVSRQSSIAAEVLGNMMADLQYARTFSERTDTAVTFTVPDRNDDRLPEHIRYAWSGTPGDPLTYQFNGGTIVNIATNVQAFNLSSLTRLITADVAPLVSNQIAFEEFTEAKRDSNGTSLAIDLPPGTVAGDLLVAAVAHDGSLDSMTAPAGWSTIAVGDGNNRVVMGVWWKLAGSSESSNFSFFWENNERAYGIILRFTGHNPSNPVESFATASGRSTNPTSPAVITTIDNSMILRLGGFDRNRIAVDAPGLSGHTAITMDKSDDSISSASGGAGYVMQATAGDSGTSSFSYANASDSEEFFTVTLAIPPSPNN